jgi:hypothetical protein
LGGERVAVLDGEVVDDGWHDLSSELGEQFVGVEAVGLGDEVHGFLEEHILDGRVEIVEFEVVVLAGCFLGPNEGEDFQALSVEAVVAAGEPFVTHGL